MAYGHTADDFSVSLPKKDIDIFDFPTLLVMLSLIAIGLISIYSATYDAEMSKFFTKQLVFTGVGALGLVVAMFMPTHWLKLSTPVLYGISLLFLVAVLIFGHTINGQKCWLSIGGFQFQPSEFAKLTTLLMLGRFLEGKGVNIKSIRDLGIMAGIVFLPMLLVLAEKDTGTSSVFMAMLMGTLLWGGADLFMLYVLACLPFVGVSGMYAELQQIRYPMFAILAVVSAGAIAFRRNIVITAVTIVMFIGIGFSTGVVFNHLPAHSQGRIRTLFEPEKFPRDEGYHVIQSMMAVGSGGLTGKGFLHGTQTQLRYIPEQWTDFIFCVPGEEFGFIGSVTVLGLLGFLILRIERIARVVKSEFESTIAFGLAAVLLYHTIVNIGMAIGVFPIMGIPLPFLSSGGTALIVNMTAIGMLLNFYRVKQKAGKI